MLYMKSAQKSTHLDIGAQYELMHKGTMYKAIGDIVALGALEYPEVCKWWFRYILIYLKTYFMCMIMLAICKWFFLSGCDGTYIGTEDKVVIDEGQELLYLKDISLKDCKKACDTVQGCNSFTFGIGGDCYLKDKLITNSIYRLQITTKEDLATYYCSKGNTFL